MRFRRALGLGLCGSLAAGASQVQAAGSPRPPEIPSAHQVLAGRELDPVRQPDRVETFASP
jgi:hypothetical protein